MGSGEVVRGASGEPRMRAIEDDAGSPGVDSATGAMPSSFRGWCYRGEVGEGLGKFWLFSSYGLPASAEDDCGIWP